MSLLIVPTYCALVHITEQSQTGPFKMKFKQEDVLQTVMGIQPWHQPRALLGKTSEIHASQVSSSHQQPPHSTNKPLIAHTNWHGYRGSVSSNQLCPAIQNQYSSPDHSRTDQPRHYLGLCWLWAEFLALPSGRALSSTQAVTLLQNAKCLLSPRASWGLAYIWQ